MQDGTGSTVYPRILIISSLFAPEIGGACAVAEAVARQLSKHVIVVAPKQPDLPSGVKDWETYDRQFPFQIHRVSTFGRELPRWLPPRLRGPIQFLFNYIWIKRRVLSSMSALLQNNPIDIVCLNTLGSYWLPKALQRRHPGLKSIFYIHGEEVSPAVAPTGIARLQHKAIARADAVVAVSAFSAGLVERAGADPQRITVINNGVDTERFTPGPKDAGLMERFELHGKRVLLCLARLDERKGQDMLMRAMPLIREHVPNAILLLVGGGNHFDRLLRLRNDLHLESCVVFAGIAADDEVLAYYRTADVYAMPNRTLESGDTEGFGLVFLEAGACGKPVIGGKAGGVPDAIIDRKTGFTVDGTSIPEIVEACTTLLLDAGMSRDFGTAGLLHSKNNTWALQAKRFLRLCESICEESSD